MKLPPPSWHGTVSIEQAIKQRRTTRSFTSRALSLNQLSQLLWSASGITEANGYKRAAPSAGALYPMDVYVVVGPNCVPPIEAGVYHYVPGDHQLSEVSKGEMRSSVARAALSQMWMSDAPLTIVITAEYKRATVKYGQRGIKYALIEAGHIGQNIFLQAQSLDLEAGIVGAFHDAAIIEAIHIPAAHEPVLLMPVGYAF
jgi:SagB-type dehydrogenase family enzyme